MNLELAGKTALVTGSTAGIGLAIATTLAKEGAAVIVNAVASVCCFVAGSDGAACVQAADRSAQRTPMQELRTAAPRPAKSTNNKKSWKEGL